MRHLALATIITAAGLGHAAPAGAITLSESIRLRSEGPCHEAVDAIMPAGVRAAFHRIVNRESGGREWAVNKNANGTFDVGCLMINDVHGVSWACRKDAVCNVTFARDLYRRAGMSPWRATA